MFLSFLRFGSACKCTCNKVNFIKYNQSISNAQAHPIVIWGKRYSTEKYEKHKIVRGCQDYYGNKAKQHQHIIDVCKNVSEKFHCSFVETPILENMTLFERGLGDDVDIVKKEMFVFPDVDNSERNLCLRPEGTAGVVRGFIKENVKKDSTLTCNRFYYEGSMFRKETPQKGRFRQFHQFGVEILGDSNAFTDIEVITMGWMILDKLGIADKVELNIHTTGCPETKSLFKKKLLEYFTNHKDSLSEESKKRVENGNVIRILDSKKKNDIELSRNAPKILDYAQTNEKDRFEKVKGGLDSLDIPFVVDETLVRGLDYYNSTIWEFVIKSSVGQQNAILAGGRYDGLCQQLGGPPVAGIGWAAGIERIRDLVYESETGSGQQYKKPSIFAVLEIPEKKESADFQSKLSLWCLGIAYNLRKNGFATILINSKAPVTKKFFLAATKYQASYGIVIGKTEMETGELGFKVFETGIQTNVKVDELHTYLKEIEEKTP